MRNVTQAWRALGGRAPLADEHALGSARPSSLDDGAWSLYLANVVRPLAALIDVLDPAIVGLAGPPGSGKTTLARCVAATLGPPALQLSMDDFYLSRAERAAKGLRFRGGAGSHDLHALAGVLTDVRAGRTRLIVPRYDTHADDRGEAQTLDETPRPLLLEGYFLGYPADGYGAVADLLDVLVFVDVEIETSRTRRFEREASLRAAGGGLTDDDMRAFWDDVLMPGVELLVPGARAAADVVITVSDDQRVRTVTVDERRIDILGALGP